MDDDSYILMILYDQSIRRQKTIKEYLKTHKEAVVFIWENSDYPCGVYLYLDEDNINNILKGKYPHLRIDSVMDGFVKLEKGDTITEDMKNKNFSVYSGDSSNTAGYLEGLEVDSFLHNFR